MIGYQEKAYLQDVFQCRECDNFKYCRFGEGNDNCDLYLNCGADDFLQGYIYGWNKALEQKATNISSNQKLLKTELKTE